MRNGYRRLNLKNRILAAGILIILLFFYISCEKESKILNLKLDIAELVCMDGQKIFEGRILDLKGIKTVAVNIQTQEAQLSYWDNQTSEEEIKTHLGDYGFTINGQPGNQIARGRLPQCCFSPPSNE